jgi:hypothetical protein
MPLIHFLLIYNIQLGRLVGEQQFTDSAEAVARYSELEREYTNRPGEFEIVLVGADSIETIRHTHGQYFDEDADPQASPFLTHI